MFTTDLELSVTQIIEYYEPIALPCKPRFT
jgi:hypothetical protein